MNTRDLTAGFALLLLGFLLGTLYYIPLLKLDSLVPGLKHLNSETKKHTREALRRNESGIYISKPMWTVDNSNAPIDSLRYRGVVFYNRVGKCGSRSLLDLMQRLSKKNGFRYVSSYDYSNRRPELSQRIAEMDSISTMKTPAIYNRHIHYLDFEKHGFFRPVYINLIRDPIARFASFYNYEKYGDKRHEKSSQKFNKDINECVMKRIGICGNYSDLYYRMLQYFCGFDKVCDKASPESAWLAIKHIGQVYTFVGLLENFEDSLRILENVLPYYFKGALDDWKQHQEVKNVTATRTRDVLTGESKKLLRTKLMVYEYEVYDYIKTRFEQMKKRFGIS